MDEKLQSVRRLSILLDSQFRIPFTSLRFGLDSLIGVIPVVGDITTFIFSAALILTMTKHGASGKVVLKMIGNTLLDTLLGSIPILGDIFDLVFKSNQRNVRLLEEHYVQGKHQGSIWRVLLPVFLVLVLLLFALIWGAYHGFSNTFSSEVL